MLKYQSFNFGLKFLWNYSFFHYEKIMRFKNSYQLPGARRTRAWHHHGSDTSTSPRAIYVLKSANGNDILPSVYEYCRSQWDTFFSKCLNKLLATFSQSTIYCPHFSSVRRAYSRFCRLITFYCCPHHFITHLCLAGI